MAGNAYHPRSPLFSLTLLFLAYHRLMSLTVQPSPLPYHPYQPQDSCLPSPIAGRYQADNTQSMTDIHMPIAHARTSFASSSSLSSITSATPPITYSLPSIESLAKRGPTLQRLSDIDQLNWAQNVLRALDRYLYPAGHPSDFSTPEAKAISSDIPKSLNNLLSQAIPVIISMTSHPQGNLAVLASYLKAKILASGSCPEFLPRDPRQAFKEFESAARGGEVRGWFRLGRDYEVVGDIKRAIDCFERGRTRGDCECTYVINLSISPPLILT